MHAIIGTTIKTTANSFRGEGVGQERGVSRQQLKMSTKGEKSRERCEPVVASLASSLVSAPEPII